MRAAVMASLAALLPTMAVPPSIAQTSILGCADLDLIYRQDADEATGWNQILPVAAEDAATADFREFPYLSLTINGQTTRYTTTGGGPGIRTRAAYIPDQDGTTFPYTAYDISGRVAAGQPSHFMIIDGELYWPECPS